jgi:hypothetical protein
MSTSTGAGGASGGRAPNPSAAPSSGSAGLNVDRSTTGGAQTANPSAIPSSGSAGVNVDRGNTAGAAGTNPSSSSSNAAAGTSAVDPTISSSNQRLNNQDRAINNNLLQGGICDGCNR